MSCGEPLQYPETGPADWSSVPFEDRISRRDYFQAAALTGILSATAHGCIKDDGYRRDAVMASSIMAGLVLEFGKAFEELRDVASRVKDPAETNGAILDTKSADLMEFDPGRPVTVMSKAELLYGIEDERTEEA